jgi:molybdopterin/thiamine biosynthesis adenylyltransferase
MAEQEKRGILIVGVGGLGAPALFQLIRDGITQLTLIDPDPVELSNLPRQIIYAESDIGTPKVIAAAKYVGRVAPQIRVTTVGCALNESNASALIANCAFVIDGTDNPATKFLINDSCIATNVPFVYGGVIGLTGQALTVIPRRTACLRCLFEEPPDEDEAASCRDAGVLGPVAGAIGVAQGKEALRHARGERLELAGRILTYDARNARVRVTEIAPRSGCACGAPALAESIRSQPERT